MAYDAMFTFHKGEPVTVPLSATLIREPKVGLLHSNASKRRTLINVKDMKSTEVSFFGDGLDVLAERWVLNSGPPPSCILVNKPSIN